MVLLPHVLSCCHCHTPLSLSLSLSHIHLWVSQQQIISARHGTQTTRGVTARLQIKPNFNRTTGLACGGGGAGGGGGGGQWWYDHWHHNVDWLAEHWPYRTGRSAAFGDGVALAPATAVVAAAAVVVAVVVVAVVVAVGVLVLFVLFKQCQHVFDGVFDNIFENKSTRKSENIIISQSPL